MCYLTQGHKPAEFQKVMEAYIRSRSDKEIKRIEENVLIAFNQNDMQRVKYLNNLLSYREA